MAQCKPVSVSTENTLWMADFLCAAVNHVNGLPEYKGTSCNCKKICSSLQAISTALNLNKSCLAVHHFLIKLIRKLIKVANVLKRDSNSVNARRLSMFKLFVMSEEYKKTGCHYLLLWACIHQTHQ